MIAADLVRGIALLSGSQAMLFAVTSTLVVANGLAGLALAPHAGLATLPATCVVLGTLAATLPASFHMERVGRRLGLAHGAWVGVVAALFAAFAVGRHSFWMLCAGAFAFGIFNGFGQYYRYAAADLAGPALRPTAISLVLAGGLAGGLIGPNLSRYTVDLLEPRFSGAYLALAAFAFAAAALVRFIPEPPLTPATQGNPGRPFREIAVQPRFLVAVVAGATGYGVMSLLMTATPIAMNHCGYGYGDAAFVISSHVVAMFAPSLVTGGLIQRIGALPVLAFGAALDLAAVAFALSGNAIGHFWWSLVCLGIGWNFLYVGGTSLLAESYRPEERAKAQGANEFVLFGTQAIASLSSGVLIAAGGWEVVNLAVLVPIALVFAAIAWLAIRERTACPAGEQAR